MAKVMVGSARIDERGKAYGGVLGDQTGKEVSTQAWYAHSKGWVLLRATDPAIAEKIAKNMQAACDNNKIGYDQWQRYTLWAASEAFGFDCAKVVKACATDCSELVRVCCAYAGIILEKFRTTNQADVLMRSGKFIKLTTSKYTQQSAYLKRGDILVTKTQGHTVVVLNDGPKAEKSVSVDYPLGERLLRSGDSGPDVTLLQEGLVKLGYNIGTYGAAKNGVDGKFGAKTDAAVRELQKKYALKVDGIYGPKSHAVLMEALEKPEANDDPGVPSKTAHITEPTTWYVRKGPGTNYGILTVIRQGASFPHVSTAENGWAQIEINGTTGWVSGKCVEVK